MFGMDVYRLDPVCGKDIISQMLQSLFGERADHVFTCAVARVSLRRRQKCLKRLHSK